MSQVASSRVAARLASLSAAPRRRDARASRAPATKSRRGAHIVLDAFQAGPRRRRRRGLHRHRGRPRVPDGTTKMCVMGGGGSQTAFGLRAHPSDLTVGIAAGVGSDLPPSAPRGSTPTPSTPPASRSSATAPPTSTLPTPPTDGRGRRRPLHFLPATTRPPLTYPHASMWQIKFDGRRTQVWRTQPPPHSTPCSAHRHPHRTSHAAARAFHVGVHPERPDPTSSPIREASPPPRLAEPFTAAVAPVPVDTLRRLRLPRRLQPQ